MNYKNADNCSNCPKSSDENGCPWWWEVVLENPQTGDIKVQKSCGKAALPHYLQVVFKAANQASESSSNVNNKLDGLGKALFLAVDARDKGLTHNASDNAE